MEENKILAYVRGNDVLFIVTVTTPERDEYGQPVYGDDELQLVPVDFTGWDDYSLRVVKQGVTRTIVAESSQLVEGEDGKIVVDVPYTAQCGTYSLELVGRQNGRHERSYEIMMFAIVESNDKANLIYEVIEGYKSADLDITVQLVQSALVYGENAYQIWKKLPGNEDKTLQDYIDEVLDLYGIAERANAAADSAEEAAETASHLPYIGADNYVYEWDKEEGEYYKTDVYVKGDPGTPADMSQLYTKDESDARYQQQVAGKGLSSNDYTNEEKAKLAGLHNYDDGPIIWLIQNLQSSLTNYYTKSETYSKTQVNNLIASVHGMEIVLVSVLPTASEETMGKIYLVPSASAAGSNTKDEYITIHEGSSYQWEVIGSTDVSLDGYVTDDELQTALASYYQKPSGGIPSTDLSSSVQTSLGKADTALQSETDPTVPSWAKASSKPSYTASEVGALPDDTPLFSGNYNDLSNKPTIPAAQVQSDWNATTGMGVILNKPTIPTVPTNVSAFTNDAGYLTSHQDISGKEDKVDIVSASGTTLTAEVGKYYTLSNVGTLAITLPTIAAAKVQTVTFYISAGSTPAVTFTSTHTIIKSKDFTIEANGLYEISAAWNGIGWIIGQIVLDYIPPTINVKTKSTGNQDAALTVTDVNNQIVTDILYTEVDNNDYWENNVVKVQYSPTGYTGWRIFAKVDVTYNNVDIPAGSIINNWAYNTSVDFNIYY